MSVSVEQQQQPEAPLDDNNKNLLEQISDSLQGNLTVDDSKQDPEPLETGKEDSIASETTKTEELDQDLPDIAPFTKDDQHHPVLVLASSLANTEKTKIVIPPTPVLDIPVRSDPAKATANVIVINTPDLKTMRPNTLGPREQEKEAEPVLRGLRHLLNNRFMSAKTLFEQNADSDPLFALALSSMAFLKGN
ncbi:hypothetical protein BCR42DRAFT_208217 [Absidia repens]|uniref:Uncharacterized protein n=1 Tax=Absidia repens TaxID=90262 RepID=A0A1X2IQ75_9FUNG|nr:hypothetical protein BCR42DRAFT_208217 [Absidia repens]